MSEHANINLLPPLPLGAFNKASPPAAEGVGLNHKAPANLNILRF